MSSNWVFTMTWGIHYFYFADEKTKAQTQYVTAPGNRISKWWHRIQTQGSLTAKLMFFLLRFTIFLLRLQTLVSTVTFPILALPSCREDEERQCSLKSPVSCLSLPLLLLVALCAVPYVCLAHFLMHLWGSSSIFWKCFIPSVCLELFSFLKTQLNDTTLVRPSWISLSLKWQPSVFALSEESIYFTVSVRTQM